MKKYLERLQAELCKAYIMPLVDGPHDWMHPHRMTGMVFDLRDCLEFDHNEFVAAVWLHNLDRSHYYQPMIREQSLEKVCETLLEGSPFSLTAREYIITAVLKHSKLDQPGDHPLTSAVRAADRLDWLGPIGIVGAAQMWAINGTYGEHDLFAPPEKGKPRNFYQDALRQTEWYKMLLSEELRVLADRFMPARVALLRAFAAEASFRHRVDNMVERDLAAALGPYYEKFR